MSRGAGNFFQNELPQIVHSTRAGHMESGRTGTGETETGRTDTNKNNDKSLVASVRETLLGVRCPPTLSTIASSD